jgi:hypothetical protein
MVLFLFSGFWLVCSPPDLRPPTSGVPSSLLISQFPLSAFQISAFQNVSVSAFDNFRGLRFFCPVPAFPPFPFPIFAFYFVFHLSAFPFELHV